MAGTWTDAVQGFSIALPYSNDLCAGNCEKPCLRPENKEEWLNLFAFWYYDFWNSSFSKVEFVVGGKLLLKMLNKLSVLYPFCSFWKNRVPFLLCYRSNISVEENIPSGTVIFQVRATDADYGNNSVITYTLLPSECARKFSIDPFSGNVTVIGNLDRENTSEIILRINATDGTFPVTSQLFIVITDVNDNGPVFTSR